MKSLSPSDRIPAPFENLAVSIKNRRVRIVVNDRSDWSTKLCFFTIREDLMWTFNDRGDMIELTRRTSGFPHELGGQPELQLKCRYYYEYDKHGNWMS